MQEVASYDSYHLSMMLSREGLICGPSSGMALQGLYDYLGARRDEGTLHDLAGEDGTVSCVFLCCDLPYQYLDEYFHKLEDSQFPPIINQVCNESPIIPHFTNIALRISSMLTCICMRKSGSLAMTTLSRCSTAREAPPLD